MNSFISKQALGVVQTNPQQWGNEKFITSLSQVKDNEQYFFISKSKGTWGGADKDLVHNRQEERQEEVELGESVVDKVKQVASRNKQ